MHVEHGLCLENLHAFWYLADVVRVTDGVAFLRQHHDSLLKLSFGRATFRAYLHFAQIKLQVGFLVLKSRPFARGRISQHTCLLLLLLAELFGGLASQQFHGMVSRLLDFTTSLDEQNCLGICAEAHH